MSSGDTVKHVAPLRAADWRFLLPLMPGEKVHHLALLGGVPGIVERVRSLGLAEHVSDRPPQAGGADVVVAAADAPDAIDRIAAAVARDGILYLEVDRRLRDRRATHPRRVGAALAAAGLPLVTIYAVEPDFVEPRVFVPMAHPSPLTWYRRTFIHERDLPNRLGDVLRQSPPGAALRRSLTLADRYVVVATSAGHRRGTPGLLRHPDVAAISESVAQADSALMLTYGGDRVIFFPFARGSSEPLAVVKVPKTPPFAGRTENEHAHMRELHERLPPALARSIPRPLGVAHIGELPVACEQLLPGDSLAKRARSRSVPQRVKVDDLRTAMRWLAAFHRATEVRRLAAGDEARRSLVDRLFRDYEREFGTTPAEAKLFTDVSTASDAGDAALPIVCQHRDYAVWNLLRERDALAVIDWEGAREGPALCDAIHLATTWLYTLRLGAGSDDEVGCVRDLFVTRPRADEAVQAALAILDAYMAELEIQPALLPHLVVHHRVELAVRRRDQRLLQNAAASDDSREAIELAAVRMLAQEAGRLFSSMGSRA